MDKTLEEVLAFVYGEVNNSHIIRLGYMGPLDEAYNLTVGAHAGGTRCGLGITLNQYDMLADLDPTINQHDYSADDAVFIFWLAEHGFLSLVNEPTHIDSFHVIPVPRRDMTILEADGNGYLLCVENGEPFFLSELSSRFLKYIDGKRSLSEACLLVKEEMLKNSVEKENVEQNELDQHKSFDSFLIDEMFSLVHLLTKSRAMTFELSPSEEVSAMRENLKK